MGKYTFPDGTTPKICIVGAGFSGLTAGIKLKTDLSLNTFQIFDENEDVGGTWLVNTYPGVACDVQSHLYSWSFEQNPNWSQSYSSGTEIWEYIRSTAKKYDLYRHITFNTKVLKMEWEENINQWRVTVLNTTTNQTQIQLFDLVISAPGALRMPVIPPEFDTFTGPKVHTAQWDKSLDLENKVVGVVGSGASAVQVIQTIAPKVKELHCYQRKPAWVSPRSQITYSETTKWIFRNIPLILWLLRLVLFVRNELMRSVFTFEHWLNKLATWEHKREIVAEFPKGDPKVEQLTPKYTLGCKRIVLSSEYYPALALSHVNVIRDKIKAISGNQITTENGQSQKLDVLILATGFEVQKFFDPLKIIGKDGIDVMATWKKDRPVSYYGITTSVAPNHFILLGPNTALGHNSVLVMIECQVTHAVLLIKELMTRNAKRVTVKDTAETDFISYVDEGAKNSVWIKGNCDSWYTTASNVLTTIWPFTCTRYWLETRTIDHSKFEYL